MLIKCTDFEPILEDLDSSSELAVTSNTLARKYPDYSKERWKQLRTKKMWLLKHDERSIGGDNSRMPGSCILKLLELLVSHRSENSDNSTAHWISDSAKIAVYITASLRRH